MYHLLQILYDTHRQKPVVFAGFNTEDGRLAIYYPDNHLYVWNDIRRIARYTHYHRKGDPAMIIVGTLVRSFETEHQFFGFVKPAFFRPEGMRLVIDVALAISLMYAVPAKTVPEDDERFL